MAYRLFRTYTSMSIVSVKQLGAESEATQRSRQEYIWSFQLILSLAAFSWLTHFSDYIVLVTAFSVSLYTLITVLQPIMFSG